jgi:hypothetical protein
MQAILLSARAENILTMGAVALGRRDRAGFLVLPEEVWVCTSSRMGPYSVLAGVIRRFRPVFSGNAGMVRVGMPDVSSQAREGIPPPGSVSQRGATPLFIR